MADMPLKKNEMPTQEPSARAPNFSEVALGYDEKPEESCNLLGKEA